MKVTMVRDEWMMLELSQHQDCGRRVDLPAKTVRRWARLSEAVDEIQAEFREAFKKAGREDKR